MGIQCQFCGKTFIEEEWWAHPYIDSRRPVKDITIDFSYETQTEDGDKTIRAYDLNGNVYRLTLPNPTNLAELKKAASDEDKQEDYPEWLRRRGNRTKSSMIISAKSWTAQ